MCIGSRVEIARLGVVHARCLEVLIVSALPQLTFHSILFNPFAETPLVNIEDAFKDFTSREDISVLLINQSIASTIRHLLDAYTKPVPAILEVPSKDQPYDPTQDSILARVKFMFGDG